MGFRELLIAVTCAGWIYTTHQTWKAWRTHSEYVGAAFQPWLFLAGWMYAVQNLLLLWDPWRNLEHGPLLFSIWTRLVQAVLIGIAVASARLAVRGSRSTGDGKP